MDGLLAVHDVSVPKALVEEAARMRNQMVQQYGGGDED